MSNIVPECALWLAYRRQVAQKDFASTQLVDEKPEVVEQAWLARISAWSCAQTCHSFGEASFCT